jgi:hypothetical protein
MRRFGDLGAEEKKAAVDECLVALLGAVVEGTVRFNDELNQTDLQAKIDAAIDEAGKMQTPWFAGEYVMEAVGDELRSMARPQAEDAYYPDAGERCISL